MNHVVNCNSRILRRLVSYRHMIKKRSFYSSVKSFTELKVHPTIVQKLEQSGIVTPNEVQIQSLPVVLDKEHAIINSETGSGKTLCFLIPVIQRLLDGNFENDEASIGPIALIVVPTLDLVNQVVQMYLNIAGSKFPISYTYQGCPLKIKKNTRVVVGTPGSICQYSLPRLQKNMEILCIDEADLLLTDMKKSLSWTILDEMKRQHHGCWYKESDDLAKPSCQLIFTAATLPTMGPKSVGRLLKKWVPPDTTLIHTKKTHCILPQANIVYTHFEEKDKRKLFRVKVSRLIGVLNNYSIHRSLSAIDIDSASYPAGLSGSSTNSETSYTLPQDTKPPKVLVFCNSVNSAQTVCSELRLSTQSGGMWWSKGLAEVHKHVLPETRGEVVEQFCYTDVTNIIVCTDVLSRGMDLIDVDLIIMFDFPVNSATFLHRAGRTARAGKNGEVLAFVGPSDIDLQKEITREREVNSLEHTFSRNRSLRRKIARRKVQEDKAKAYREKQQMSGQE